MEQSPPVQLFGKQRIRTLTLIITLTALVYAGLLLYGDAGEVVRGLRQMPAAAVWALGVSLASFALRGVRWQLYLGAMRIDVPWTDSALVFTTGLAMSITPGKVGEVLKSLMLKERHDVPVVQSGPIVICERLMDLGAILLIGITSLLWPRNPALAAALASLFVACFFAFGRLRRPALVAIGLLGALPVLGRFRDKLLTAHASLHELWTFGSFAPALALSVAAWGVQALSVAIFAHGLGEGGLSVPEALIAYFAPLLAGTLALLPGGLGLTEASMVGVLRMLSGMSTSSAATITILTRLVTFWLAVVLGMVALGIWRARRAAAQPGADGA